jgi:putative flippase GtrA
MDSFAPVSTNPFANLLKRYPIIMQILRFVAIGFLNTGLSFVIANLISKYFGIVEGNALGYSSAIGFLCATFQSYFWQKYWAFGEQTASLLQNFLRLVWVGLVGVLTLVMVYLGSQFGAAYFYYIVVLIIFFIAQYALWHAFGFGGKTGGQNLVLSFFIVSLIGFLINFFISSRFSAAVHLIANPDLNKNLALVVATCVSLIWNFIGYKLFVFKK